MSREGARVTAGAGPCTRRHRTDVIRRHQWDVGGQLHHADGTLPRQHRGPEAAGGGVAAIFRFDQHPRAIAGGQTLGFGIAGHHQDAGEPFAPGERAQHVLQHRGEQRLALDGVQRFGQTLLGVLQILDRQHRPKPCPVA